MAQGVSAGRIVDVFRRGRTSSDALGRPIRLDVLVADDAPRWVVLAIKEAFDPLQGASEVSPRRLSPLGLVGEGLTAAVVLAGGDPSEAKAAAAAYAGSGVPVALVAESALDLPELGFGEELDALCTSVCGSDETALLRRLADWALGVSDDHVAMAANFAFLRDAECERLIRSCAMKNAGVGAVDLLRDADLPVMTANQIGLAFDLAAAHGEGLSWERAVEALVVLGASMGYRSVAREVLAIMPGIKPVVRGGIAFLGTELTGRALEARLKISEGSLDLELDELLGRLSSIVSREGVQEQSRALLPMGLKSPGGDVR